ncbi:MAG: Ig-like domain-containing protein [Pirellulaceae bacterium]|nr:Ig-like domain-containing protein [Pirellulaceae bacterium]
MKTRRHNGQLESLEQRVLLAGDLVSHWTADALNDNHDNGQVVADWNDIVSNVVANSSGAPLLVKNALSGHSVIRFNTSDGADSFRVVGNESPLANANDFTVAVVFSTSSEELKGGTDDWSNNTGLVDANRAGFGRDWGMSLNASGQIGTGLGQGLFKPHESIYSNETGLNDGQFHLATVSRTGGTLDIYIDDGNATTMLDGNALAREPIDLTFGILQQNDANPFNGDIAEIRIFNGALDASEVTELNQTIQATYNNSAPTAADDSYAFQEDPTFGFNFVTLANSVLNNDTDPESNSLSAVLVSPTKHGALTLNPDGSFTYAPVSNFFGEDSFTYTANDSQVSNTATVTINVSNVYDPAIAVADSYKAVPAESLIIDASIGLLANDENADQTDLSVQLSQNVGSGSLSLNADGSFIYDPQGFAGTTSFRYQVNDGTNTSAEAEVTLIVNTPPTAQDDSFALTEDVSFNATTSSGVSANDSDADGDTWVVRLVDGTSQGELVLNEDGSFNYTPNPDSFGSDSFQYILFDGEDESNVATVNLTIDPVNDSPSANADAYFAPKGDNFVISAADGLLANDTDIDSTDLTAAVSTEPSQGQLELMNDGSFVYTPNGDFIGVDSFSYVVSDGNSQSTTADVSLFVGAAPIEISEVMSANATSIETRVRANTEDSYKGDPLTPDWIEIHNLTSSELDLSGYHLTDNSDNLTKWALPAGTTLPAAGYLVVAASRLDISNPNLDEQGMLHTNFKLNPSGEYLAITSAEGDIFHEVTNTPDQRADVSFGIGNNGETGFLLDVTPGAANGGLYPGVVTDTAFSVDRGYYSEAFQVEISTAFEGAAIRYTTDGSNPSATHGDLYSNPITISTTTVLKAIAFKESFLPSNVDAQTYVFAADVLQQDGADLGGARWGHRGADWAMDPIIVNHTDPEIRPEVDDLMRIPTVSLSLNFDEFFGSKGIYIRGENVERPVSFEFFDPHKPDNGVQANSTVQIVGGSSPNRWKTDKLSMRVRFTEDQGPSDLNYPIFGTDAISAFDTLVVDARLNNVWHYGGGSSPASQRGRAQYMRDEFAADLQNAVGGTATHAQHVNVYINGIYWGLHTLHERPDDNFVASYLGGNSEDYNVIKHGLSSNDIINGSNQTYRDMFTVVGTRGDLTDEQWSEIQTRLDINSFIDYMLVNFYGGNGDWDHHNWYASEHKEEGLWRFHSWDAEKVLEGARDDKTRTNNRNAPTGMHRRLSTHPEYVLMFADRVQQHFHNGGAMTPEAAAKLYADRSDQIDLVMRAESARWGDNQIDNGDKTRYTRPDWTDVRNDLYENYFPQRTATVITQFGKTDLFIPDEAPEMVIDGIAQHGGFVNIGGQLTMTAPDGDIYYTTDETDPRVAGGAVADGALSFDGPITIGQSTMITARLRKPDGTWSAANKARFTTSVEATTDNLRISEVHYHPSDPTNSEIAAGFDSASDFEFIEIVNLSESPVDLADVRFEKVVVGNDVEGIDFRFSDSEHTEIAAGARLVVVEDLQAFQTRYGSDIVVAGEWSGRLSNSSEQIVFVAGDTVLHDLTYDEAWHPTTDGEGPSLQVVNESAADLNAWKTQAGWRPSNQPGGSPGTADGGVAPPPGDSNHDGVFDSSDLVFVFQAGKYEDGVPNNTTFEEGDWDGNGEFDSSDFVYAFQEGNYADGAATQKTLLGHPSLKRNEVAASLLISQVLAKPGRPSSGQENRIPFEDTAQLDLLIQSRDNLFDDLDTHSIDHHDQIVDEELLAQLTNDL